LENILADRGKSDFGHTKNLDEIPENTAWDL
jgi:hypothetical protein